MFPSQDLSTFFSLNLTTNKGKLGQKSVEKFKLIVVIFSN